MQYIEGGPDRSVSFNAFSNNINTNVRFYL